ncbi:ribosome maturation protein SBDS-like isoform X2 [Gordionus sp. m RMFG-2023]
MKKGGKHFEIACYKNKVQSWRNKIEKDIDEVLQTPVVFANLSRGQIAKKEDLISAFGTDNMMEACLKILEKGDLQISDKERQNNQQTMFKDIATIVSNKCINPETNKPYPITMIENAMKEIHYSINPKKNSKQQALDVIKKLKETISIERVQMKIKLQCSAKFSKKIIEKMSIIENSTTENKTRLDNGDLELVLLIDPGTLRSIDEIVRNETKGQGIVEIISVNELKDENN